MAAQTELNIWVKLKDDASKAVEGIKGKLEDLQPTFKKMAAVGTAVFAAVTAEVVSATSAYQESERAQRQLEHAVIDVSKGTADQVKQIGALADALQRKSGIDGDALKMGAAQLSTFGLQSESVVNLTKSLADLTVNQNGASASADSYVQSANVIAKALNGQFGALEKSGIRFTETQQNMILYGTEAQKVAAIQEGLNQNLRETTDTLSGTGEAALNIWKQTLGDIQEKIGEGLAPALGALMEKLQPLVDKVLEWVTAHPQLTANILLAVGAVAGLVAVVGALGLALPAIITGFTILAGPVGIIIAIIGTLIFTIKKLIDIYDLLHDHGAEVWEGIKLYFKEAVQWIYDNSIGKLIGWINDAVSALDRLWEKAKSVVTNVGAKIGNAVSGVFTNRDIGGPVSPGTAYTVGEHGPETFIPSMGGTILPAGIGGGSVNIIITDNSFIGERDFARKIGDQLADLVNLNKLK